MTRTAVAADEPDPNSQRLVPMTTAGPMWPHNTWVVNPTPTVTWVDFGDGWVDVTGYRLAGPHRGED